MTHTTLTIITRKSMVAMELEVVAPVVLVEVVAPDKAALDRRPLVGVIEEEEASHHGRVAGLISPREDLELMDHLDLPKVMVICQVPLLCQALRSGTLLR
uniref:Uncharacterized protein n=1 Tax=Cacopsylla melanoneura TaxID=428564 RepID=A0A8D8UUX0_9HEMI